VLVRIASASSIPRHRNFDIVPLSIKGPAFDQLVTSLLMTSGRNPAVSVRRHDRSLLPGGGRGLRVRRGTNVAEREDIFEPPVPQRQMVYVDPADIAGERTRPHKSGATSPPIRSAARSPDLAPCAMRSFSVAYPLRL
jgi:hypothetical protein